jgi:NADPH:quinone reductase-like Zn-dependent oxidoreductase
MNNAEQTVVRAHGGPEQLRVEPAEAAEPGPRQVLIEVEAAGVAYADVLMRLGIYPETPELPFTPGYDVVGRVVAKGSQVGPLPVGTRVAALTVIGGYSTHALASANLTVAVPDHLPAPQLAALVLNYVTAHQMLHRIAKVPAGGSILVHGAAGGVGTALLELAAAHDVLAYGSASGRRTAAVTERGGIAIDRRQHEVVAEVLRQQPEGVTATFDPIGGPQLGASRRATTSSGTVVSYGISFAVDQGLARRSALRKHVASLVGSAVTPGARVRLYVIAGKRGYATKHPDHFREDLDAVVRMLQQGQINPQVMTLPLAQSAVAHEMLESQQVTGKLVLTGAAGP